VRQVLVNLVNNATKFTRAGGVMVEATHRARSEGGLEVEVSVADTGIGIPRDRRNRLFEAFTQVDASHAREYGGTGLGLAISQRLCELMGGRLWLDDTSGPGSTFRFTFRTEPVDCEPPEELAPEQIHLAGRRALLLGASPFTRRMIEGHLRSWRMSSADPPEAGARLVEAQVAIVEFGTDDDLASLARLRERYDASVLPIIAFGPLSARERMLSASPLGVVARLLTPLHGRALHEALLEALGAPRPASRLTPPSAPPAAGPPLRILLADDSVVNQKVALQMLGRLGYRADVAGNGREVLEALGRQAYDVVFLDVQMPEMDGLEAARRIRGKGESGPWLIAMTANALQGDREICLAAGMNDYLAKPVSPAELAAALGRARAEARAPETGVAILDTTVLSRLQGLEDEANPTLMADILGEFLKEAPLRAGGLEKALAAGDRKGLGFLAHSLKGSAGMIGAMRLQATCAQLEETAALETLDRLEGMVANVHTDLSELQDRIVRFAPTLKAS
jgi:CheY-like chemotaxis protein/HPt (histidine-containing phosphotransfer) domain-containing protein